MLVVVVIRWWWHMGSPTAGLVHRRGMAANALKVWKRRVTVGTVRGVGKWWLRG